jgi:hypothetical protein
MTLALVLTAAGTTRHLALPGGISRVPLGPITVTATAENTGALKGTATVSFNNLSIAVRHRFINEGGNARLGDFQFGFLDCNMAVYQRAAISAIGMTSRLIGV